MTALQSQRLSRQRATDALRQVGRILGRQNTPVVVTVTGSLVYMLLLNRRVDIGDVDYLPPTDPYDDIALREAIEIVGKANGLANVHDGHWMNDSAAFFGLREPNGPVLLQFEGLTVRAPALEELLTHTLEAYRDGRDVEDAIALVQHLNAPSPAGLLSKVMHFRTGTKSLTDIDLIERFRYVWSEARRPQPTRAMELDIAV